MAKISKNPEQYKEILSVAQMLNSAVNKGTYFASLKTTE